jgi:YfiH family protein
MITAPLLTHPAITHAFFGRQGGVSDGVYASLNIGYGSKDARENVARNRALAMNSLGLGDVPLVTTTQTHSAIVHVVTTPFDAITAPEGDGLVTNVKNIALGVQTADCAPVLFYEPEAGVIGAAHAGWKGALGGILEATVRAMEGLGAATEKIIAAIGPCIQPSSYEVDRVFYQTFLAQSAAYHTFFTQGETPLKFYFDLPNFVRFRLYNCGVTKIEDVAEDTASQPEKFFSFRRATQQGEADYGRELSVICLHG